MAGSGRHVSAGHHRGDDGDAHDGVGGERADGGAGPAGRRAGRAASVSAAPRPVLADHFLDRYEPARPRVGDALPEPSAEPAPLVEAPPLGYPGRVPAAPVMAGTLRTLPSVPELLIGAGNAQTRGTCHRDPNGGSVRASTMDGSHTK